MSVRVKVPSTTANLGPGYDIMGMALNLHNYVEISPLETSQDEGNEGGLKIEITPAQEIKSRGNYNFEEDIKALSPFEEDDLLLRTIEELEKFCGTKMRGIKITEELAVPPARGMGISAAGIAGTLMAAGKYFQLGLSDEEIFYLTSNLEGHKDNAAAACYGGLNIIVPSQEQHKTFRRRIHPAANFKIVIVVPEFSTETKKQRSLLPKNIPHEDAVFNLARTSLLPLAIKEGKLEDLRELMRDKLHQTYRSELIPGWKDLLEKGYSQGAAGIALSGAGPSLLAFAPSRDKGKEIGESLVKCWDEKNIKASFLLVDPTPAGMQVVKQENK